MKRLCIDENTIIGMCMDGLKQDRYGVLKGFSNKEKGQAIFDVMDFINGMVMENRNENQAGSQSKQLNTKDRR